MERRLELARQNIRTLADELAAADKAFVRLLDDNIALRGKLADRTEE